jgi:predicted alpha/beta superfamily hydrolase
MPYIFERYGKLPVVLGGYSLAGLFARWAVCKAECFDAVAAASPSLWITAWKGFSDAHEVYARYVYLSLGDREEITKNKAIAQVGTNVRWEYDHLQRTIGPDHCTLVWEKGGHFVTPHLRLARAFAWCINKLTVHNE